MKTNFIRLVWVILFSVLADQPTKAQQRGAVWVHGLGDDSRQWRVWAQEFTGSRQLFSRNALGNGNGGWSDYGSLSGVIPMAANVRSSYGNVPDNRTIYFGHSMGGVVGRDIDVNHTGDFGGIITAGSPLDGARIANATRNGEAQNAIQDGVNRVISGPSSQFGVPFFLALGVAVDVAAALALDVLDKFKLRDYGNQGGTDLQEGSGYLTSAVRNTQTATPKIHIYGNEDGPGIWRLASQATSNSNSNDEHFYVDVAQVAGDVYEVAMWENYALAFVSLLTLDFWQAAYFTFVAVAWSEGMNWWRYDSERDWNHLIGADIAATKTVSFTNFNYQGFSNCMNQYAGQQATYEQYIQCQNQNTYQDSYTYYASQNGQSDAFIKAPSQVGYNSNWSNNATAIEARGVNHLEMDTHPTMRNIYNDILNQWFVNF